jgi:hypothetical protein
MPAPICVAGGGANEIVTITSTTDQTATTETAHATMTILANSISVGTTWRMYAWGNTDNGTTAITFTPRIRWVTSGSAPSTGVQLLTEPFTASTTTNTNSQWALGAKVTIRTIGATGTAVCDMVYVERASSATEVETAHADNSGVTAVTIDTTVAKDLVLSWELNVTTGAPHVRTIGGYIELVKA